MYTINAKYDNILKNRHRNSDQIFVGGWVLFQTAIPQMISKLFVTVIVVILNFFISKFFAFKSKEA